MTTGHVAVIDVGKTNVKLALADAKTLAEGAVITRKNTVLPGPPWPHFDHEAIWAFLLEGLAGFHHSHRVSAISITTHGAACALINADGDLAAPILDYEHTGPDLTARAYDALRPGFEETGSPRLAAGLNIGAQLHWQFHTQPDLWARVQHVLTYPQYWGYRLTGEVATDVTSLGCHTDLWNPFARAPSALVQRLGLSAALAPPRRPGEVLGQLLPGIAARTGLPATTPVHCGIHDSNASLLPHLARNEAPFGVVSTGTWVIAMAVGGANLALDPGRDVLVNVNALGDPVPSARFMGGREHDLLMVGTSTPPSDTDIASVLDAKLMLLPAVVPTSGPYQGRQANWIGSEPPLKSGARTLAVSYYLALMTARCLALIGHRGPVHVEGPFATNPGYLAMLASATGEAVFALPSRTGTSQGAAMLAVRMGARNNGGETSPTLPADQHKPYVAEWRAHVGDW